MYMSRYHSTAKVSSTPGNTRGYITLIYCAATRSECRDGETFRCSWFHKTPETRCLKMRPSISGVALASDRVVRRPADRVILKPRHCDGCVCLPRRASDLGPGKWPQDRLARTLTSRTLLDMTSTKDRYLTESKGAAAWKEGKLHGGYDVMKA